MNNFGCHVYLDLLNLCVRFVPFHPNKKPTKRQKLYISRRSRLWKCMFCCPFFWYIFCNGVWGKHPPSFCIFSEVTPSVRGGKTYLGPLQTRADQQGRTSGNSWWDPLPWWCKVVREVSPKNVRKNYSFRNRNEPQMTHILEDLTHKMEG